MDFLPIVIPFWIVTGFLGAFVAIQKHRTLAEGFAMGLIFGPFGVLIEALLPTLTAQQGANGPPGHATHTGNRLFSSVNWLVAVGRLTVNPFEVGRNVGPQGERESRPSTTPTGLDDHTDRDGSEGAPPMRTITGQ